MAALSTLSLFGYAVAGGEIMRMALDAKRKYQRALDTARRIARDPRLNGLARANAAVEAAWQAYEVLMRPLPVVAQLTVERA